MGRSQRHMLLEQNTTAAGEIHAQGTVAPGIALQVDPSALNATLPGEARPPVVATQAVKTAGNGVEVPIGEPGGPLSGSSLTGAIPEELGPGPGPGPGPEPEPGEEPELHTINPSTAHVGGATLTMHANGSNFTETSLIYFNGGVENTTFVNDGQLSTQVKPSLASGPITVPVWVQQGSYKTAEKMFEFTEPVTGATTMSEEESERTFPIGPLTITRIEDRADGLAVTLADGDVRVGDDVLIEATGNTTVNGTYEVLSVEGSTIIIDHPYELVSPIEAKGRLTVNDGEV